MIRDTKGKRIKTVSPEVETIEIIKTPGQEQEYEILEIKTEPGQQVYTIKGDREDKGGSRIRIIDQDKDAKAHTLIQSSEVEIRSDKNLTYYVDGEKVSKRKFRKLDKSEIATMDVIKKSDDKGEIHITTKKKDN